MAEPALRTAARGRHAPAIAGTLALAMACAVGATETGAEPDVTTLLETTPETPLGNDRHVCAYYDAERATYTGTVAVLERADDNGTGPGEGDAYRLLVLTTHEDAPEAAGEPGLTGDQALALLANAQAAQRGGQRHARRLQGARGARRKPPPVHERGWARNAENDDRVHHRRPRDHREHRRTTKHAK